MSRSAYKNTDGLLICLRIHVPISLNHVYVVSSDDIRQKMMTKYLNNPDYNFEKVNRASQACGPMVKWAIAQVLAWQFLPTSGKHRPSLVYVILTYCT